VVEPSDLGKRDYRASLRGLEGSRLRRVVLQGLVGSRPVIVGKVVVEDTPKMLLVHHDDVIEALSAN
jgi:hypothetical protein